MTVDLAVKVEPQPVGLAQLSSFLKTLCEENRMRILCFLMQGERSVCDLSTCLDLPQNLVSHHTWGFYGGWVSSPPVVMNKTRGGSITRWIGLLWLN